MKKLIVPQILLKNGLCEGKDPIELAKKFSNAGADAILLCDLSSEDEEHDVNLHTMKQIYREVEVPLYGAGNIKRVEDVKKILYTGCAKAVLNYSKESCREMLEEVSKRFGQEKIAVSAASCDQLKNDAERLKNYADIAVAFEDFSEEDYKTSPLDVICIVKDTEEAFRLLAEHAEALKSAISWNQMKLNSDGMVPVIVQDYRTDEVLMLAYMNEEAFEKTLETGLMTYYSRSRNCLWTKGLTSGHVQYVKSLTADCDLDTILAKVSQIGPACHTGKPSCFFNNMVKKEYKESNPRKVFENVYATIMDRKLHPKEGSYTNYLFDKGIDKILKKLGEEATEIVIAAKNPEPEEIKYEMADFLYHAMVMMAEKGITWDEIIEELDNRH